MLRNDPSRRHRKKLTNFFSRRKFLASVNTFLSLSFFVCFFFSFLEIRASIKILSISYNSTISPKLSYSFYYKNRKLK